MTFVLQINCDNAAFEGDARNAEVAYLLRKTATQIIHRDDEGILMDSNGNRVGSWAFREAPFERDTYEGNAVDPSGNDARGNGQR